jgi:hypothetical protein
LPYHLQTLQLDITGIFYDAQPETVIAPGSPFTLDACLIPGNSTPRLSIV